MTAVHPAVTDPELRRLVAALPAPPADETDAARLARLRANPSWRRAPDDDRVTSADGAVGGVRVRVYTPTQTVGTLVFAHGGGWVAGTLDANDGLCRDLAAQTGCRVVSVDYRLAPEHPFPAGLDDVTAVLDAVARGTTAVGVAGHSAGGNLAAAVALRAREGLTAPLHCQVLLCPVLDAPSETASYRMADRDLPLTGHDMRWYWDRYAPAASRTDPFAAPSRAPDLAGAAPAVIVAAAVDPLHDEAVAYAGRLRDAGVAVTLLVRPGVPHLFLTLAATASRDEALRAVAPAVRAAFAEA